LVLSDLNQFEGVILIFLVKKINIAKAYPVLKKILRS